jgi:glycosyltransferase involved in cell wall biosynthesis
VIVSMSETVGIPMAAALRLIGARTPHVVVGHRLAGGVQRRIWRHTSLQHSFAAVVTLSRPLREYAASGAGMGVSSAHFLHDKVDQRFFRPLPLPAEDYVLAVGQEQRDYGTLLRAVAGSGMGLVIVASSPWASVAVTPDETRGVTVLRGLSYPQLRELYARARLVAVPVHPVSYAAGVNGLLEGMAMGKAVVSTRSPGLEGYVKDGVTGVLVPPHEPAALREALAGLWDSPGRRAELGRNARAAVEEALNLDRYLDGLSRIVAASAQAASALPAGVRG